MPKDQPPSDAAISIPTLDLKRQFAAIQPEIHAAIERVCASQQFVLGPEVEALEQELATYVGSKHAVACASGTDALWLALAAAGVGPGDRVITTPFSFFASASSIVRTVAEPVFVDIDPDTLNLDPRKVKAVLQHELEAVAKSRIKALLPVHLYGQCADMTAFQQVAAEHSSFLIEDAAQAIGARWQHKRAGSIGLAAAFSFYPTKNLSAYGDAGVVTTSDSEVAKRMRHLRNHGSAERYVHTEFGWNARMDAIQAAVLRVKLKHIDEWNEQRRKHAQTYNLLLRKAGLVAANSSVQSTSPNDTSPCEPSRFPVQVLQTSAQAFHVFHQYVIRARRRDQLREFLRSRGVGSEVYYPIPLHLQPVFSYLGYKQGNLPEAERAANEVMALPMFPELTPEEIETVVAAMAEFYS